MASDYYDYPMITNDRVKSTIRVAGVDMLERTR